MLSIGQLARRTGISVSAIRFYEARGLVRAARGPGNQRRFARSGTPMSEIEAALSTLPHDKAPTRADWRAIGARMRGVLEARIATLQRTQELLDGCIGCGCLSLDRCALYNPNDRAARAGPGPRFLLGNKAADFADD